MRVRLQHKSSQKRFLQVVVISLFFIGLGFLIPRAVSSLAAFIMYPIHATSSWLSNSSSLVPTFIRDRQSINNEIEELKNKLAVAEQTDLTQSRLLEENNNLRQLLGIGEEVRIAAAIIARPDKLPYDLLQIDRGLKHNIKVGAPVFIGRDIVIGLVVHTAPEYSFVQLATTPGFQASAFISGPNVAVTMEGVGGGVARVRVPQGIPISIGDLVYLPSVEPGVFGRISFIENRPTQPEQYGYISPEIAISSLYRVSVGQLSQISRSVEEIDRNILELMKIDLKIQNISVGTLGTTSSSTPTESI